MKKELLDEYIIAPDPDGVELTKTVEGLDHQGNPVISQVIEEKPLTIYLNSQEIVTAMTIGDYPEYLAVGFLKNQGMLDSLNPVISVDYDDDLAVVVVRTESETSFEEKLKKKTRTSGCAVGTVFGDMMEGLEGLKLPTSPLRISWLYDLSSKINRTPHYTWQLAQYMERFCARKIKHWSTWKMLVGTTLLIKSRDGWIPIM